MAFKVPSFVVNFFAYETSKSVMVKSWSVGIVNRFVQLLIILYFICWVFLHEKGHQQTDTGIESVVMTKVKGLGTFNNRVMDVADYVVPSQGGSSFSIITNMVITANQTRGLCPEVDKMYSCTSDRECASLVGSQLGNGILTGRCSIPMSSNDTTGSRTEGRCESEGWCPAENDSVLGIPMKQVENFTILIKNSIRFPLFNVTRGSFPPSLSKSYIKSCNYDPEQNSSCPIFKVGNILRHLNQSLDIIAKNGGEIGINIAWKCNLDYSVDQCKPQFSFTRSDAVFAGGSTSKGYNFRFAKYYMSENGTEYRTLYKAQAIRFEIIVSGNAGKFGTVPFLINFVAAFTSVGLASVFCDIILLNFHKGASEYKAKKFEEVTSSVSGSKSDGQCNMGSQMSVKAMGQGLNDSGTFSVETNEPRDQNTSQTSK